MGDKRKEELKEDSENHKSSKFEMSYSTSRLLNILLSIIVIITVITGSVIYYSLYKFSKDENSLANDNENVVQNQAVEEDVSTVADIIDTALNTNTVEENTTETEEPQAPIRKYYYSYNRRS